MSHQCMPFGGGEDGCTDGCITIFTKDVISISVDLDEV